jgi:hypothetical protein
MPRASGSARAGRGWRRPGEGARPPVGSEGTKTGASSCHSGPTPGSPLALARAGNNARPACGLRGAGLRASGVGSRSPTHKGRGGCRAPGPAAWVAPLMDEPFGSGRAGSARAGPVRPAEPRLCMTQGFLEEAVLLGSAELGVCWRGRGSSGTPTCSQPTGTRSPGFSWVVV